MLDSRATLHTILQGSTVDLFHSFNIAVAPLERHLHQRDAIPFHEISGIISFTGRGFTGSLSVGVPAEVFDLMRHHEAGRGPDQRDWIREVTNQLCGRVKSRLLPFQIALRIGVPVSLTREGFERHKARGPFFAGYLFRTLRGEIVVTVAGDIRHDVFVYSGVSESASEGDIILF